MARPRAMRWRYNSHGAQEIEMETDEYAEQKIMALRKMKRRYVLENTLEATISYSLNSTSILFLSILYALVSCFLFILGLVVSSTYDRSTKFQKPTFGMSLNQLYYIVSILSFVSTSLSASLYSTNQTSYSRLTYCVFLDQLYPWLLCLLQLETDETRWIQTCLRYSNVSFRCRDNVA